MTNELNLTADTPKGKTISIYFAPETAQKLTFERDMHSLNLSSFISSSIETILSNAKTLEPCEFSTKLKDYRTVNITVHKEVAKLLNRITSEIGVYDLAISLSYLIATAPYLSTGNPFEHIHVQPSDLEQVMQKLSEKLQNPNFITRHKPL